MQRIVKEHSQHTIGVEFSSRTVKLGEKRIKLQVSRSVSKGRQSAEYSGGPAAVGYGRAGEISVSVVF